VSVPEQTPPAASAARLADLTYRTYDGPRKSVSTGWWTIASMTMRMNVKKVGFWIPAILTLLFNLFWGMLFYIKKGTGAPIPLEYASTLYKCVDSGWLMLMLMALVVGSGAIAADTQANALLVYFSRPITKAEYLWGKWLGVFLMLAAATLLPALLVYLFFVTAYTSDGFLKEYPWLGPKLVLATLIGPAINTSLVLGFSALSRSARVAGASFAGFFFILSAITTIFGTISLTNSLMDEDNGQNATRKISKSVTLQYFNVEGASGALSMKLFGIEPKNVPSVFGGPKFMKRLQPPIYPPLILATCGLILLPLIAAHVRVRAVEVVAG
jgi:ABC-2 type transport system permease protein